MALARIRQENQASTARLQRFLSGNGVLEAMGYDHIPTDHNPVYIALAALAPFSDDVIQDLIAQGFLTEDDAANLAAAQEQGAELAPRLQSMLWNSSGKPNKSAVQRAYLVCQTACLNAVNGPMRNGYLATARIRWYFSKQPFAMGFKLFAQLLETALIQSADIVKLNSRDEVRDAQREGAKRTVFKVTWTKADEKALEEELGRPVRVHTWPKADGGWVRTYAQNLSAVLADLVRDGLTYEELWVRDASREYTSFHGLIPGFHGILAIEKEGEYEHFAPLCRALGMPMLLAMGGNNAFSGVEYIINQHLRDWGGALKVNADDPLHLFVISDFDWAGYQPVCEAAFEQFKRYLGDAVVLHRVGLEAEQLAHYDRSIVLAGYRFNHLKNSAYEEWAREYGVWVNTDTCYGIEMEALDPNEYAPFLIDAIIEACGGDDALKEALAKLAEPEWYDVKARVGRYEFAQSRLWRLLRALSVWADDRRQQAETPLERWIDARIDTATVWRHECGHEIDETPEILNLCPECGQHDLWAARREWDADDNEIYTCPCGHVYDGDPYDQTRCPECGGDLLEAEPQNPWKDAEHVKEAVGKIVAEAQKDLDFDEFVKYVQSENSYGVWRPADSEQATNAAADLFVENFGQRLDGLAQALDVRYGILIEDLESAFSYLSDWDLEDPDA